MRWDIDGGDDLQVLLPYRSPDGEEGYPGTVETSAHYRVENDGLSITCSATVDRVTPLNLTNHAYLNLSGRATIVDHLRQVHADRILEVDSTQIPTGRILPVTDTHFDLRKPVPLRQPLAALSTTGGLDHHFVCGTPTRQPHPRATLSSPTTGLLATLHLDQPAAAPSQWSC